MELVVTAEGIRHAKLQSYCHHQQTNTQLFAGRMPFLLPSQYGQSTEGKGMKYMIQYNTLYCKTRIVHVPFISPISRLGNFVKITGREYVFYQQSISSPSKNAKIKGSQN